MRTHVIVLAGALALAGCAADSQLVEAARKNVRTVRLGDIPAPPTPTVFSGMGAGSLLPLVELAANRGGNALNAQSAEARSARVAEAVRREFVAHLSAVKAFPAVSRDKGDATLELEIKDYGLYPGGSAFRPVLQAGMRLSARLVMPDGKVVWSDSESGTAEGALELFEFIESPSLTRERFRRAAELAALKLLEDMDKTLGYDAADALAERRKAMAERIAAYDQAQKAKLAGILGAFPAPGGSPQVGDTWSYRLLEPQRDGSTKQRSYVVRVAETKAGTIREELMLDGQPSGGLAHAKGLYVANQGVSLPSPYMPLFAKASAMADGRVEVRDESCNPPFGCSARAQIAGVEDVTVPAGTFETLKLRVEHGWQPAQGTAGVANYGSRMLAVYYSPKLKRAVKFTSILQNGIAPPVDADFVLELESWQEK